MNRYFTILSQFWLSPHAINIYTNLIEKWSGNIQDIATWTQLQRVQIYRNLPSLFEKGCLFTTQIGKRTLYHANNPQILRREYEQIQKNTLYTLGELEQKFKNQKNNTDIYFWKGIKAIQYSYQDILDTLWEKWIFYRITWENSPKLIEQKYIPSNYKKERDTLGIRRQIILSEKAFALKQRKLERHEKIVRDKDCILDDDTMFTIYGDKVALVDFKKETVVIIDNPEISAFQKKIFELLYKKLT
jgi:sugar-specific transcriptional regulator TrmB